MSDTGVFRAYRIDGYPSVFPDQDIRPYSFTLSRRQALEDLAAFQYLLDTSYSGREFWEKQGNSFSAAYARVADWIRGCEGPVAISGFLSALRDRFSFIHDGHLSISSAEGERASFAHTYKAYFADVLLKDAGESCTVVSSRAPDLPVGRRVEKRLLSGHLFPTLSPSGETHYYIGRRSWTGDQAVSPTRELVLDDGGEAIRLLLHPCRASKSRGDHGVFSFSETQGIPVVRSSVFWEGAEGYSEARAAQFEELGRRLRSRSRLIWDMHDNGGGDSDYPQRFLHGLNENAQWRVDCATLSSPAILRAKGQSVPRDCARHWTYSPSPSGEDTRGAYGGAMYLLTSERVGSSAEAAVSMATNVPHCVRIGESTGGRGTFGETLHYELPHSRLVCCVPHKLFLSGAEEGIGYAPDYWLDTPALCEETIQWLKHPKTYQAPIGAEI